jgi:hypothetical protein
MKSIPVIKLLDENSEEITNRRNTNTRIRSRTQTLYHAALSHIEPTKLTSF